jgi:hypothetical protein
VTNLKRCHGKSAYNFLLTYVDVVDIRYVGPFVDLHVIIPVLKYA